MNYTDLPRYCTRCGVDVDPLFDSHNDEYDYVYCATCEASHQAFLAYEFPCGQCQECGAVGKLWENPDGTTEIFFHHIEGACSKWADFADMSYQDELRRREEESARLTEQRDLEQFAFLESDEGKAWCAACQVRYAGTDSLSIPF